MSLCASGILMAALSSGIVLADIVYSHFDRALVHLLLGAIISFLFFILCKRGYEIVNWTFLLIMPVSLLILWIINNQSIQVNLKYDETCEECGLPLSSCSCGKMEPCDTCGIPVEVPKCNEIPKPKPCGCPPKPITPERCI